MKVSLAQIKSAKGDVPANIIKHKKAIMLAVENGSEMIIFPELSLTGYEPTLAKELAMSEVDQHWGEFQKISDIHNITIVLGVPIGNDLGVCISLMVFQPNKELFVYSKKYLHSDEKEFFVSGQSPTNIIGEDKNIALAICYEVLVPEHSESCIKKGVEFYIASVAKGKSGVKSAKKALSEIAKKHSVYALMSNTIGSTDNFISFGGSLIVNPKGERLQELGSNDEGLLTINTKTQDLSSLLFMP